MKKAQTVFRNIMIPLKTGGSEITYNGAVLQQIRKMKSISINELAQITCIRGAYLKAIEEEDFRKIHF